VEIICTSESKIASGAYYSPIYIPVRVTASAGSPPVLNIASVNNPKEKNKCNIDGSLPTNATTSCATANNSDPAYFTVGSTGGPGGSGPAYVAKVCTNGVAACTYFNSNRECIDRGLIVGAAGGCYDANAIGLAQCQAQTAPVCAGPGGPGPSTTGGGGYSGGRCGDGILGSSVGEECDLGDGIDGKNGKPGSICTSACKVDIFTNPGANPITDIWMTISTFGGTKMGYSWLDGTPGKIRFEDNRIVLGNGTRAFTLADEVGFGVKTQYPIPLMLEYDKELCLK
jgi:hypothetical protein